MPREILAGEINGEPDNELAKPDTAKPPAAHTEDPARISSSRPECSSPSASHSDPRPTTLTVALLTKWHCAAGTAAIS